MNRGKLIVFEGINGCGKWTQVSYFTEFLYNLSRAKTIFRTREPNEFDENGKLAREMLSSDGDPYENASKAVEYFARNRQSHNQIFAPMLEQEIDVISDRYWYSNFAFQGPQGINYEKIAELNKGNIMPDLTFIIDVDVEEAFRRLENRDGKNRRKFDSQKEFLQKVRVHYLGLPEVLPNLIGDKSIFLIDGMKSRDEIQTEIRLKYLETIK